MIISLQRGANDLYMVQLIPLLPIVSCFIKIRPEWFTFLVPAYTQVVLENRPFNECLSFVDTID